MKKYFKLLLCTCLLGVVATSCSNDDDAIDPGKYMPISNVVAGPKSLSVIAAGDSVHISVEAAGAWTATVDADWVAAEKLSGEGPAYIKLHVASNHGTADRTATVNVTSAGKTSAITITQSAEYYTTAKVSAEFSFALPSVAQFVTTVASDVTSLKLYAVPTTALEGMSVSDKLSFVQAYGKSYSYSAVSDEDFVRTYLYDGLTEGADYTLLFVGTNKDGKFGTPSEITFKTPASCNVLAELTDISLDENNWYITSPLTQEQMPGYYVLRIADTSSLFDVMKNGDDETITIAQMIYLIKSGATLTGVECRYVNAGETAAFERIRKDVTKNADAVLFITWAAAEDFSQASSKYYVTGEILAEDYANK